MQLDNVFSSESLFRKVFVQGLENMLLSEELGAYILVLANASFEPAIYQQLQEQLRQRFLFWVDFFSSHDDAEIPFAPDDVAVFRKLMGTGFDALVVTEHRMTEMWQLQHNLLRSFRPGRNASRRFDKVSEPFDENGFHFNKPFLQKEVFWEGELAGHHVKLLYNKFPFASLHGLFVIDPGQNKPQLLQKPDHELVWEFLFASGSSLPVGMGYNSLGAYASVNHQHFQSFVSRKKYPVELACWEHNGGQLQYPLACRRFLQVDDAWDYLKTLHEANIPYNLLYRPGEMYCINRAFQGWYEHSAWTGGFAWSEVFGAITTSDREDFAGLDAVRIIAEFQKMRRL